MKSIEDRMKEHGLTLKVKKSVTPWDQRPLHLVKSIAKNPNNGEEVRLSAFAELDRRKKA